MLSGHQFYVLDALSAPGVDGVEVSVAGLDDAGVGVLRYGRVFQGHPMIPVKSVVGTKDTKGRSRPFLLVGLYGPVVTDEGILEGE